MLFIISIPFVKENLLFDPMCLPQSADISAAAGGTFWFTQWWYIGECSALPQYVPHVAVHTLLLLGVPTLYHFDINVW